MRKLLVATVLLLLATPAHADFWSRSVSGAIGKGAIGNMQIGKAVEKEVHDTGKTIEKATHDVGIAIEQKTAANADAFLTDIQKKTDSELLVLVLSDICAMVECHGMDKEVARQAVNEVRTKRKDDADIGVKRSQVTVAEVSAGVALVSLLISVAGFVRAGRKTTPSAGSTSSSGGKSAEAKEAA
jgi:hypothetical protein